MIFKLLIFLDKDITDSRVCLSSRILEQPWLPFSLPAPAWTHTRDKRRRCCAGKGSIPWRLLFCAFNPQGHRVQEIWWWRKLVKIQAHSAVRDLTPREGALRTNTAHSGPCCTIIANCRHFEACFPTYTSSTKSTSSQCLGMDSPASRSLMHSQCITSTAVALIFPCPEGNAAMAAATVLHGSLSPQPSVQALNPLCTEP